MLVVIEEEVKNPISPFIILAAYKVILGETPFSSAFTCIDHHPSSKKGKDTLAVFSTSVDPKG